MTIKLISYPTKSDVSANPHAIFPERSFSFSETKAKYLKSRRLSSLACAKLKNKKPASDWPILAKYLTAFSLLAKK